MPAATASAPRRTTAAALRAAGRPALAAAVGTALLASGGRAQAPGALAVGPLEPEVRVDALIPRRGQAVQLGVGAFRSVGRAVRAGVVVGGGVTEPDEGDDRARFGSRAEVVARFVVRTTPTGRPRLYAGAGAGALWATGGRGRAVAHALVGVQGGGSRWEHAVEVGLGGGVRLGLVLRRAR